MKASVENFFSCITGHPAMNGKVGKVKRLLIGSDTAQHSVARSIIDYCPQREEYSFNIFNLETTTPDIIRDEMDACDIFVFIYDSSNVKDINPRGPDFIAPLKSKMADHWKKSVLLREYGELFEEAFSENIQSIATRNHRIISIAKSSNHVTFHDGLGGVITGSLGSQQAWKSLDGRNHYDLMPGEVATRIEDLCGTVRFGGTFLSTVPFAIKYGVIDPIVDITIEASRVVNVSSSNHKLEHDLNLYLDNSPGNRVVEEFGIGTNTAVRLHGRNASFEERHAGLHLGLGGGMTSSHHLDLIFQSGEIRFDETLIFSGGFRL